MGDCFDFRYHCLDNLANMEIVGTKEAFLNMLQERGVYKKLGVDRRTASNWKRYAAEGKISLDKMEEMLIKYGAEVVQEKVWYFSVNSEREDGRRSRFSREEADEIRKVLKKCREADREIQKDLRSYLRRKLGFYISDYTSSKKGLTPEDFDKLIEDGRVEVS